MTSAHTPGPWSYNRDQGGMHGHVISTGEYIICDLADAGDAVAPHTEANARLIASAPEMLEALELCEDVLSELSRLDDGTPSVSALLMAREAIAKAVPAFQDLKQRGPGRKLFRWPGSEC